MGNKTPLGIYVGSVIGTWVIILAAFWYLNSPHFGTLIVFCAGFFVGLLATYIAVHFYKWR